MKITTLLIRAAAICFTWVAITTPAVAQQHRQHQVEKTAQQNQLPHEPTSAKDPHSDHREHSRQSSTDTKEPAAASSVESGEGGKAPGKINIPDLLLLDQDGKRINFYRDLVQGKVVVINFIFTTCTTICPPLGATFARVQKEMGESVGRDVHFISISVDPATDTPERLKAWGEKFKAGPGWTFVTGDKPSMDQLLKALAASSARPEDHSPTIIIGHEAKGQWTRTYGLAKPSQLVKIINNMLHSDSPETTGKEPAQQ